MNGVSNKTPVVMISGLNCDGEIFKHQIAALEERGHEVTVIDHTKATSNQELAANVLEKAPKKFILIGLSLGGYASFEILKQNQDRVEKVVLLNTSARADTEERVAGRREMIERAKRGELPTLSEELWPVMVSPEGKDNATLFATYKAMSKRVGADGFVNQMEQVISRGDFLESLGEIKCPTLVVAGEKDQLFGIEIAQEIVDRINAARDGRAYLSVIGGAGHISTMEKPQEVTEVITRFLSRDLYRETDFRTER